ncbi:hypothetical protein TNCV_2513901 [Trichonephila clavipes]|nr:hypothetical protein TNCV_2513901 [Trichonephila clavipes]
MASPEIFQPIIHYSDSPKKITAGFQRGRSTGAVFLDIQKSFRQGLGGAAGSSFSNNPVTDRLVSKSVIAINVRWNRFQFFTNIAMYPIVYNFLRPE